MDKNTIRKVMAEFAKLGGAARAKALTPERRARIARKAARARWSKPRRKGGR